MNTILDISGAIADEGWRRNPGIFKDSPILDFKGLEGCRRYCDGNAARTIREALKGIGPEGIHIIDTGDFHYLTLFFLEKIREPFSLVLLDNHPDDQTPAFCADTLSCGGWVETARRTLPYMKEDCLNRIGSNPSLPVYLSIDIDILSEEYAATGWSQGNMTADELLGRVSLLRASRRIIGADICGGLSRLQGASEPDIAKNRRTKEALIRELT